MKKASWRAIAILFGLVTLGGLLQVLVIIVGASGIPEEGTDSYQELVQGFQLLIVGGLITWFATRKMKKTTNK